MATSICRTPGNGASAITSMPSRCRRRAAARCACRGTRTRAFNLGCPVLGVDEHNGALHVTTPKGVFRLDFLIFSTGFRLDWAARPEFSALAPHVRLWRDRYTPRPGEEDAELSDSPDLGPAFELREDARPAAGTVARALLLLPGVAHARQRLGRHPGHQRRRAPAGAGHRRAAVPGRHRRPLRRDAGLRRAGDLRRRVDARAAAAVEPAQPAAAAASPAREAAR